MSAAELEQVSSRPASEAKVHKMSDAVQYIQTINKRVAGYAEQSHRALGHVPHCFSDDPHAQTLPSAVKSNHSPRHSSIDYYTWRQARKPQLFFFRGRSILRGTFDCLE